MSLAVRIWARIVVSLELIRPRESSHRRALQSFPKHILVLCYGNIYRSPLAEKILDLELQSMGAEIRSAGFHERENRSPSTEHVQMCRKFGFDISTHRSQQVDAAMTEWADLILVMDRHNLDRLLRSNLRVYSKTAWLGAFGKYPSKEIIDPYGLSSERAENVIQQIIDSCRAFTVMLSQRFCPNQARVS